MPHAGRRTTRWPTYQRTQSTKENIPLGPSVLQRDAEKNVPQATHFIVVSTLCSKHPSSNKGHITLRRGSDNDCGHDCKHVTLNHVHSAECVGKARAFESPRRQNHGRCCGGEQAYEICRCDRRRRVGAWQGHHHQQPWAPAQAVRHPGHVDQNRPVLGAYVGGRAGAGASLRLAQRFVGLFWLPLHATICRTMTVCVDSRWEGLPVPSSCWAGWRFV